MPLGRQVGTGTAVSEALGHEVSPGTAVLGTFHRGVGSGPAEAGFGRLWGTGRKGETTALGPWTALVQADRPEASGGNIV